MQLRQMSGKRYRCTKCGDILEEKKLYHEMQWCRCHSLGLDWISGTEAFRIVGSFEVVEESR